MRASNEGLFEMTQPSLVGAEQDLELKLQRLEAAGASVPARTDLGFFALIELGSLRDSVLYINHTATRLYMILLISVFFGSLFRGSFSAGSVVFFIISLITLILLIRLGIAARTLRRAIESYESRIKPVWERPIAKRFVTPPAPVPNLTTHRAA